MADSCKADFSRLEQINSGISPFAGVFVFGGSHILGESTHATLRRVVDIISFLSGVCAGRRLLGFACTASQREHALGQAKVQLKMRQTLKSSASGCIGRYNIPRTHAKAPRKEQTLTKCCILDRFDRHGFALEPQQSVFFSCSRPQTTKKTE